MRISMWLWPTLGFIAVAACIVQREASLDGTDADAIATLGREMVSEDTEEDRAATPLALPDRFAVELDENWPLTEPSELEIHPVWNVIDRGTPGDVLAPSDVPILAISQAKEVPAEPPLRIAANDRSWPVSSWEMIGSSVKNEPIHVRRYGTRGDVTLIIGGLDGTDRIAVKWIDNLSQELKKAPETADERQVLLMRDPNPDGLRVKQEPNSRGVMINRNFPTPGYRPGDDGGPGPASEPETRAILEVLYRFQPTRVIHLQSSGRSEVIANPAAEPLATLLRDARALAGSPNQEQPAPGSLEEFVTNTLGIEMITLRLSTGDDWQSAGLTHYPTLMAAAIPKIAEESLMVAQKTTVRSQPKDEVEQVPSPFGMSSEITRLDRSGYEELPPPPHKPSW